MNILLKKVKIIAPGHPLNGAEKDILIQDGAIKKIGTDLKVPKTKEIAIPGACVSPGWVDIGVESGEPGFEHREDFESLSAAAAAGGFTAVACQPDTDPVVHSKSGVMFLRKQSEGKVVQLHAIGAISRNCEGHKITEMLEMKEAGALTFSDGNRAIQNSGLMMRALQYVKPFGGVVINQPMDALADNGHLHEGPVSTSLGLKGIPSMAEELMVQRDIYLLEYTDSRLHLANISTADSVDLVRKAKKRGLNITASVASTNLAFDDGVLYGFNTNYKVMPPLRSKGDIKALKQGLKDGVIDLISSNHVPRDEEEKKLEFAHAEFGAVGLETTFSVCNTYLEGVLSLEEMIEILAYKPRRIFGLDVPEIKEGAAADLTLFSPDKSWEVKEADLHSKSKNSPFIGVELKGKVEGVINNGIAMFPGRL